MHKIINLKTKIQIQQCQPQSNNASKPIVVVKSQIETIGTIESGYEFIKYASTGH